MIRYRLQCSEEHQFEGWFQSSAAYEAQEAAHQVVCPLCGGRDVRRAVMAPRITQSRHQDVAGEATGQTVSEAPAPALMSNAAEAGRLGELIEEVRAMRRQLLQSSDYVGPRFAEEARRIHFEEAPNRAIHGEASADEVAALNEDGIDVLPLPRLPEDAS